MNNVISIESARPIDPCICWVLSKEDAKEQKEELGEDATFCKIVLSNESLIKLGHKSDYKEPYVFMIYGLDEELMNYYGWHV
jgi:hypothetical protein